MKNILETFQTLKSEKLQTITEKLKDFCDQEGLIDGIYLKKLSFRLAGEKSPHMSEDRINIALLAQKYQKQLNGVLENIL